MTNPPTYDAAAVEVVKSREGAVMFKGWIGPTEGEDVTAGDKVKSDKTIRFFTYRDFRDWLEIRGVDILYHAKADAEDPEDGSVIWVRREAFIKRCHSARAYEFDEQLAEMADDPTARHPRP
jgi:hypothetical protein